MLTALAAGVPHGFQARVPPQVINVPVRALAPLAVVIDTGPQAAGAERSANVQIVAETQTDGAQASDADGAGRGAAEPQEVGAEIGEGQGSIVEREGRDTDGEP